MYKRATLLISLSAVFALSGFSDTVHWSFTGRGVGIPCPGSTVNTPTYCSYDANLPFTFSGAYYTDWIGTTSVVGVASVHNLWADVTIQGIGTQTLPYTTLDSFQVPTTSDPNWRSGLALLAENGGVDVWAGNVPAYDLRSDYTSGPVTAAVGYAVIGDEAYALWDLDAVNPENPVKTVEFQAVVDPAPEPVSWGLAGLGVIAMVFWRRRGISNKRA